MTSEQQLAVLKQFARGIIWKAWEASLDGSDAQELAVALGLCVEDVVGAGDDVDADLGDAVYRFAPWLREEVG